MIGVGGLNFSILEAILIIAVILLLIDKLSRTVDRRRLHDLEKAARDQAVSNRVYDTPRADLVKRANERTIQRIGRGIRERTPPE